MVNGEGIPYVRHEVETEDLGEPSVIRPCDDSTNPQNNTNVGKNDLVVLMRREHDSIGFEVYAEPSVDIQFLKWLYNTYG
jgi:hypothetical protein